MKRFARASSQILIFVDHSLVGMAVASVACLADMVVVVALVAVVAAYLVDKVAAFVAFAEVVAHGMSP